jgi:hypothetical protein
MKSEQWIEVIVEAFNKSAKEKYDECRWQEMLDALKSQGLLDESQERFFVLKRPDQL